MSKFAVPSNQPRAYNRYDQERFTKQEETTSGFKIQTTASYHGSTIQALISGEKPQVMQPPEAPLGLLIFYFCRIFAYKQSVNLIVNKVINVFVHILIVLTSLIKLQQSSLMIIAQPAVTAAVPRQKKRPSTTPIIIVPSSAQSLITTLNATDILQELRFVSNEEKRVSGTKKETDLLIQRVKTTRLTVPYRIVDNPLRLQADDWRRVVAVFVHGPAWQFKGWPVYGGNPVDIFSHSVYLYIYFLLYLLGLYLRNNSKKDKIYKSFIFTNSTLKIIHLFQLRRFT